MKTRAKGENYWGIKENTESEEGRRILRLDMSLVDYAASSDEDEPQTPTHQQQKNEQVKENFEEKRHSFGVTSAGPSSAPPPTDDRVHAHNR